MASKTKRPLSVTIMSIVYILAGATGIIYHAPELLNLFSQSDQAWILTCENVSNSWWRLCFAWQRTGHAGCWLHGFCTMYISDFFHETTGLIMHGVIAAITVIAFFNKRGKYIFHYP